MKILKVISLRNKKITLDVLPKIGGKISSFICDDFHILRPIPIHDLKSIHLFKVGVSH